jgi:multiple antibiotic resistance protein
VSDVVNAFLLAFPALLSIVNPVSSAFIFRERTARFAPPQRKRLTRLVAAYSFLVMMVALWAGSYVLGFFGITLAALRVAGGLMVSANAWMLMNAPEVREARKQEQSASMEEGGADVAFFPLTIPFTTGPGTISVAIALGAGRPHMLREFGWYFVGMTGAALVMAVLIWATFGFAERVGAALGPTGSRAVTRIFAFLLLCIGVQILINGVEDVLGPLLAGRVQPP